MSEKENWADIFFDSSINYCLESIENSILQLDNDTKRQRLESTIYNTVLGSMLIEQLSELDKKASQLDYIEAKERAENKSKIITKIIVSGMQADSLAKILCQSAEGFKFFYKKYFLS